MFTALTIAGSDSSGGAGIQADIKTMTALGVYAESCITALTAQNTLGVRAILEADSDFLKKQIDCVFEDIFPDAVKLGMISNASLMEVVAERLSYYKPKRIVIDPVMVSTSGSKLMDDYAIDTLKRKLLPLGGIITPNIPETEVLTGHPIHNRADMENAAKSIYETFGCTVLVKGGHGLEDASDFLYGREIDEKEASGRDIERWFCSERVDNPNTHGTGCTLSSAIAAFMARGESVEVAVEKAKAYLTGAIMAGLNLGNGPGPLNHMYAIVNKEN